MANSKLERISKFLQNFELQEINGGSSILNNFVIVSDNFKAIFGVFKHIRDFLIEMYESFDQSKIVESIYNQVLKQRLLLELSDVMGKSLHEFDFEGRKLVITSEKTDFGIYEIYVDESSAVQIDIHKLIVQFRGIETIQHPTVDYHTTVDNLKKIRLKFIDNIGESKSIMLY